MRAALRRSTASDQRALAARVSREPLSASVGARQRRRELMTFVEDEVRAGRLTLSPPRPTPLGWKFASIVNAIAVPLVGLIALPVLIVLLPLLIVLLRTRETHDPEVCPRPQAAAVNAMQELEDYDVTNQFTAIGPVKPGMFPRWPLTVLPVRAAYACRPLYTPARPRTLHPITEPEFLC